MSRFFILLLIMVMFSCEKETDNIVNYKVGDIHSHSIYNNMPYSIDLISPKSDSIIIDTLSINFESESSLDFSIIIEQAFITVNDSLLYPTKQVIYIRTSDKVQLQLHPGFENESSFVKSSTLGDEINLNQSWTKKIFYSYTQIQGNFRISPRPLEDYLAVLYNSEQLGWIKIKTEMDKNWVIQKFSILEYCIWK